MARVTADIAKQKMGSQYDLVIVASKRAREIANGSPSNHIKVKGENPIITAIREIEVGAYTKEDYFNTKKDDDNEY